MTRSARVREFEKNHMRKDQFDFNVGDVVDVHTKIVEGGKERTQIFTGTVIARSGSGISETFSIHRIAYGAGMERVFCLHSPRVEKIVVKKHGHVRRAKLYYLRGTRGKAARVKGKIMRKKETAPAAAAPAAPAKAPEANAGE
ncbi:MAG: 50S ribosomal protein L19 [Chlamydiia bacterium]|nr:50S ribosomal protein L19 [Chlamydiia bacterium]